MRTYRHSLKALRDAALAYSMESAPDLAALSRELGGIINRDAQALADGLGRLRERNRGYERWLLGRRGRPGVSVLVMAWPPGYSMPAHDHAGLWGIEMSLYGALEVESWTRESTQEAWQWKGRDWLGPGDGVWFESETPYMHQCRNLSKQETALSLHVYGGDLEDHASYERTNITSSWHSRPRRVRIAGPLRV